MSTQVIADRYAEAIFQAALEAGGAPLVERIDGELASVVELLDSTPDLNRLWMHPVVGTDDKKAMVRQLLNGKVHPLTLNGLLLLFDKKRGMLAPQVQKGFRDRFNAIRKRTTVLVTSAFPLDAQEQEALRHELATKLGQDVAIETAVDSALIGGMVLQIGDQVIDNSLRGRLASLRHSLV